MALVTLFPLQFARISTAVLDALPPSQSSFSVGSTSLFKDGITHRLSQQDCPQCSTRPTAFELGIAPEENGYSSPSWAYEPTLVFPTTPYEVALVTDTQIITLPPITTTISFMSTVTETVTLNQTISIPAPTPSRTLASIWVAPTNLTDLSSFNISSFPGSRRNLAIVKGIPASATPVLAAGLPRSTYPAMHWDNSSTVLQLRYPAHSINPGHDPQGGAQFYASPLHIATAKSVTFQYSVFFPADFDWVLAGKLPGLYGGHTGCSGGNSARSCFSTRLMWRRQGVGEMYLYAPKDKQTKALCDDPQSICDADYGFSIGRGCFNWTAGAWTTIQQTVALNTPGKQDGGFALFVNGRRVLNRDDIFYRDAPTPKEGKPTPPKPPVRPSPPTPPTPPVVRPPSTPTPSGILGGILGPLLGGLLGPLGLRADPAANQERQLVNNFPQDQVLLGKSHEYAFQQGAHEEIEEDEDEEEVEDEREPYMEVVPYIPPTRTTTATVWDAVTALRDVVSVYVEMVTTKTVTETATFTQTVYPSLAANSEQQQQQQQQPAPVGFSGIFFSTFFGGHEEQYATPRDQYVWFKDFALACED